MDGTDDITFRDYQLDTLRNIFKLLDTEPAGPPDDPVVSACSGDWAGKDGDDGRFGETLAEGPCNDDEPPF